MNIRIGKSFGLALMLALGVIATMLALGMFTSGKVGAAATGTPTIGDGAPSPGANVEVEVTFTNDGTAIDNFGTFTIELEGWGLPASIDERDILVRNTTDDTSGNPVNVDVSDGIIEIELNTSSDNGVGIGGDDSATVVIRKRAGLTAPATAGKYDVTVDSATASEAVTVSKELSASPEEGGSGTTITVSGKAFADGTATLHSRGLGVAGTDGLRNTDDDGDPDSDRTKITDVNVRFGAFSTEVAAADLVIGDNGYSRFEIVDADGNDSGVDATGAMLKVGLSATAIFQVTGTTTISPTSMDRGGLFKISLSDWIGNVPNIVRIGGVAVNITDADGNDRPLRDADGAFRAKEDHDSDASTPDVPVPLTVGTPDEQRAVDFYVKVSGSVAIGTKTLALFDGSTRLDSTSIEITSMALSVDPSSAVVGQEITVEGSGFSGGALLDTVSVGGKQQTELSNGSMVSATRVTSGGRVVLTFVVPDDVTDGSNTVAVTDADGRIGEVSLTVPEPMITLDPVSSRRDSTVVATGSGFPANKFIDIEYGTDNPVATVRSNSMGNWATTISIPINAEIGGDTVVFGKVTVGTTPYEAEAEHSVPGADITLSTDTARGGDIISITGEAFPAFQPVIVQVGGLSDIATGANTDGNGNFSTSILLPALAVGTHLVEVRVGRGTNPTTATKVLTVPEEAPEDPEDPTVATNDTADVFAAEIAADNLARVWMFSNEMQAWSFFDPRPAFAAVNTYTQVSSGDIVWVNVAAQTTFQGRTLFPDWNLISLTLN